MFSLLTQSLKKSSYRCNKLSRLSQPYENGRKWIAKGGIATLSKQLDGICSFRGLTKRTVGGLDCIGIFRREFVRSIVVQEPITPDKTRKD